METTVTVSDLIGGALNNVGAGNRLVRSSGSYIVGGPDTGTGVLEMLRQADWTEVTDEVVMAQASFGSCRYFKAPITEGQGVVSVSSIDGLFRAATGMSIDDWDLNTEGDRREDLKTAGQRVLNRCSLVWGEHGPEIRSSLTEVEVDHMVVIIGDPENPENQPDPSTAVVYTWHPGMPVAPSKISSATIKLG